MNYSRLIIHNFESIHVAKIQSLVNKTYKTTKEIMISYPIPVSFASVGEIIPPCGVPSLVGFSILWVYDKISNYRKTGMNELQSYVTNPSSLT